MRAHMYVYIREYMTYHMDMDIDFGELSSHKF